MTTEQKAKKYDEALEWMRKVYPTLTGADKEDAEHYFPELKESKDNEDERIRKDLIKYLESDRDCQPLDLEKELQAFLCNYDYEFDDDAPAYDIARHFYELGLNAKEE